ncbi:Crp/Fnr family transcriptional regulator [Pleurocapsales cyanobacterium LEGE 10410]|nr:Crp/Fnr family transcriptional regulator [Pleurocapsales cyanobacterium LEGE 10410]
MLLSIKRPPPIEDGERDDTANRLLKLLPKSELHHLLDNSERIVVPAKTIFYQPNQAIEKVYFPLQGVVSLMNIGEEGLTAEVAMVSEEGAIGVAALLGNNFSSHLAIAQTDYIALSFPTYFLRKELNRSRELHRILLLYSQALFFQVSQNVFCSCHHTLEQRLARWLLAYRDRLQTSGLLLTQETLADLLGVRRSSLSVVATDLRQRNLIYYNRGKITISNYQELRQIACKCDRLILDEYSHLLNWGRA